MLNLIRANNLCAHLFLVSVRLLKTGLCTDCKIWSTQLFIAILKVPTGCTLGRFRSWAALLGLFFSSKSPRRFLQTAYRFYLFISQLPLTQKYWRGRWSNFPEKGTLLFPFLSRSAESAPNCPFTKAKEITQSHNFPWPGKSAPLLYIFLKVLMNSLHIADNFSLGKTEQEDTQQIFLPQNYSAAAKVKKNKVQKGPGYFWQPYSKMHKCECI